MENNNDISTLIVGMLLEMKEVIISKTTKQLDLNRMIAFLTISKIHPHH